MGVDGVVKFMVEKDAKQQSGHHKGKHSEESLKGTIESIVIAFILAFIFRAYVVEAFIIPTGSMAPTLLGAHVRVTCEQCGYTFKVDSTPHGNSIVPAIVCPMCRYPNPYTMLPVKNGDRILVQKYTYVISEPRRWDVVVFKNPQEFNPDGSAGPTSNYIKRLVGLPNESVRILDGNVYIQKLEPGTGKALGEFKIARKAENLKAQEAVFRPIYYSQYIPLDGGKRNEKRMQPYRGTVVDLSWEVPWVNEDGGAWEIENRRSYLYQGEGESEIKFDFARGYEHTNLAMYPYNELKSTYYLEPIEDVRLSVAVNPERENTGVRLSTTARWDSKDLQALPFVLSGEIDANGVARLTATDPATNVKKTLKEEKVGTLKAGRNTELQLWYVDQQLSLWIDGVEVLRDGYDLPIEFLAERRAAAATPDVKIAVSGPAELHEVKLDRDQYYATGPVGYPAGFGSMRRSHPNPTMEVPSGPVPLDEDHVVPFDIGEDEYFVMGDNSPWSLDSRAWQDIDPWVAQNYFGGEDMLGVVPGELMIGRAFFVYFPAPFGFVPNFGDMRFIH